MTQGPESDADRKMALEIEKLRAEITNLTKRWWVPPVMQSIPTLVLILVTSCIAVFSGVLDAKRDNLSAQNERLTTQKLKLEAEEREMRGDVEKTREELAATKEALKEYQVESEAVEAIRRMFPHSIIGYAGEPDGLAIELQVLDWTMIGSPKPQIHPNVAAAIHEMARLRNLRSLTIKNILLNERDIKALEGLTKLESLRLENNGLIDPVMASFPVLKSLQSLYFSEQQFTHANPFNGYSGLRGVFFNDVPITDDGIRFLSYSADSLNHVSLTKTLVTDKGLDVFQGVRELSLLSLTGSMVTETGIRTLAQNENIKSVFIAETQISDSYLKEVQKKRGISWVMASKATWVP